MGYECGFSTVQKGREIDENSNDIEFWCSIGRTFSSDVKRHLTKVDDYTWKVTNKEQLDKLQLEFTKKLDNLQLKRVVVTHGLSYTDGDKVTLTPVDGIQVEFDDGSIRQLYDEVELFVLDGCDSDTYYAFKELVECVEKLKSTDLETEDILFWESY